MYTTKFLILDRDGVINHDSPDFIKSADEWIEIENSFLAIKNLSLAGWIICIATNQSGLGRGKFTKADLDAMHTKMLEGVSNLGGKISQIEYCPHLPSENCMCRKPKSGMLEKLARDQKLNLKKSIVIGDSTRDLEAGLNVSATVFLVLSGKGKKTYKELCDHKNPNLNPKKNLQVFENLYQASKHILENTF